MPLFACRWPNGDVSFVLAPNKEAAIEQLDEIDNAEGCPVVRVPAFQIHLKLNDEGEFEFEQFGEAAYSFVVDKLYPLIAAVYAQQTKSPAGPPRDLIRRAVQEERERVRATKGPEPRTQVGKDIKGEIGMPTSLINKIVDQAGRERLKKFDPDGEEH